MENLEKRIADLEMEIKSLKERTEKIDAVNEAFRERLVNDIPGKFKQRKDKGDMVYHFYPPGKDPKPVDVRSLLGREAYSMQIQKKERIKAI